MTMTRLPNPLSGQCCDRGRPPGSVRWPVRPQSPDGLDFARPAIEDTASRSHKWADRPVRPIETSRNCLIRAADSPDSAGSTANSSVGLSSRRQTSAAAAASAGVCSSPLPRLAAPCPRPTDRPRRPGTPPGWHRGRRPARRVSRGCGRTRKGYWPFGLGASAPVGGSAGWPSGRGAGCGCRWARRRIGGPRGVGASACCWSCTT